jgi:glucokinase
MNSVRTAVPALAFDIGGTMLKAGLIAMDGTLMHLRRQPTPADAPPERVAALLVALARELCEAESLDIDQLPGLGVSIAAFITDDGLVTATAHLSRTWVGYDLGAALAHDLPLTAYFALDTPAPTLGEQYFGAGRGVDHFVYMTVSTGIGAGIVADGRYFTGGLGWAGGLGHIIIDEASERVCSGCGNHGCLETFAATQGILAAAADAMRHYPESSLHHVAQPGHLPTPQQIADAAHAGDAAALAVWHKVGHALGIGVTNVVNIVSPRRVVIGGGIAQAGDLLFEPVRAVVRERAFPPRHRQAEVVPASLGDLSGLYGAAAMVFHDLRINPRSEVLT